MTSDLSYFKDINSIEKAYCLGFFINISEFKSNFSDNCYELSNIDINFDNCIINCFKKFADIIFNDDDEDEENKNNISITLIDDKIIDDIKLSIKNLMSFDNDQKKAFLRGLYEYSHLMTLEADTKDLILIRPKIFDDDLITKIFDYVNIPYIREPDQIIFKFGCSSVDLLGFLYSNINNNFSIKATNYNYLLPYCNFIKTDENAINPSKSNWSDVGFDLSIIKKIKDFNSKSSLYDTGIKIQIPFGYYAEIVPRSSISKYGYILSNNIGIIDNSYRGNLMIALTKIADDANEIEFPFKCCQLIFKKQLYINLVEVTDRFTNQTKRNEGGFGSTDIP